jgi:hypothetical protein
MLVIMVLFDAWQLPIKVCYRQGTINNGEVYENLGAAQLR